MAQRFNTTSKSTHAITTAYITIPIKSEKTSLNDTLAECQKVKSTEDETGKVDAPRRIAVLLCHLVQS